VSEAQVARRAPLKWIPIARPAVAHPERVARDVQAIVESGVLTNGPYVRELERRAASYLGVRHCIAVASCTSGLMLVLRAAKLTGDVVIPSFTFAATAHAVAWNGLRPVFADVDKGTLTLDPDAVLRSIGTRTSAILATHVYGTPADIDGLESVAAEHGIRLIFDAAHAFGSLHGSRRIGGFGDAEVFSLSPTKVVAAGEGGIIATNDDVLAERCRIGRDYGNPGDYDCRLIGLNARMSELHAALALASVDDLDARLDERNRLAEMYRDALSRVAGITFPSIRTGDRSTYKDFTVLVHEDSARTTADELSRALRLDGIETKRYYDPPVHRMRCYQYLGGTTETLPVTEVASKCVLTLPLWSGMSPSEIGHVTASIARLVSAR
jgi:dTDP-4-amino-4,6-dideoxygalactose transaminase